MDYEIVVFEAVRRVYHVKSESPLDKSTLDLWAKLGTDTLVNEDFIESEIEVVREI